MDKHVKFYGQFPDLIHVDALKYIFVMRFILKQFCEAETKMQQKDKDNSITILSIKELMASSKYKFSMLMPCTTDNNNFAWLMEEYIKIGYNQSDYTSKWLGCGLTNMLSETEFKNFLILQESLNLQLGFIIFDELNFSRVVIDSKEQSQVFNEISKDKNRTRQMFMELRFENEFEDLK